MNANDNDVVKIGKYLVFYSIEDKKLFCDCMPFILNITDSDTKECIHIKKVKELDQTTV